MANGKDQHPFSNTAIITVLITVGLAVLAAFWQLSDPRADLKAFRETYLTIREHNEFSSRLARDVLRLEEENRRQMLLESFLNWKVEHERLTSDILTRLEQRVTKEELAQLNRARELQWQQMYSELVALRNDLNELRKTQQNHERDDRDLLNGRNGKKP